MRQQYPYVATVNGIRYAGEWHQGNIPSGKERTESRNECMQKESRLY